MTSCDAKNKNVITQGPYEVCGCSEQGWWWTATLSRKEGLQLCWRSYSGGFLFHNFVKAFVVTKFWSPIYPFAFGHIISTQGCGNQLIGDCFTQEQVRFSIVKNRLAEMDIPDICHFFWHKQNFWKIEFTPKFTQYIANLHSKLPIFCVKSVKIYTGQNFFTRIYPWNPWQIWGMLCFFSDIVAT